jgi:Na+/melibiose symporter-like transporter
MNDYKSAMRRPLLLLSYFLMSAAGSLPGTALMIFSAERESPMFMAAVLSGAALPWGIKSIMGAISDSYPLCAGLHRAPYIMMHAPIFTVTWAIFAEHAASSDATFALCILLQSWCLVWVDCMLDAIMCEMVQTEAGARDGKLQSDVWISRSLGSLIASAAGGLLLRKAVTLRQIFYSTGLLLLPTAAVACELEPRPGARSPRAPRTVRSVLCQTFDLFRNTPQLSRPTMFLTLVAVVPSCGLALNYFLRNELHYTPTDFAIISVAGDAAHVAGAIIFKLYVRTNHVRRTARICVALTTVLRLLQLLLALRVSSSVALACLDEVGLSIATEFLSMPVLAVAANHIPSGCEGTAYSAVLGAANLGGTIGVFCGGAIAWLFGVSRTEFTMLWAALLLTSLLSALPVLSVHLLPPRIQSTGGDKADSATAHCETSDPRTRCAAFVRSTATCAQTCAGWIQDKWNSAAAFRTLSVHGRAPVQDAPMSASADAAAASSASEDRKPPRIAARPDPGPALLAGARPARGGAQSGCACDRARAEVGPRSSTPPCAPPATAASAGAARASE